MNEDKRKLKNLIFWRVTSIKWESWALNPRLLIPTLMCFTLVLRQMYAISELIYVNLSFWSRFYHFTPYEKVIKPGPLLPLFFNHNLYNIFPYTTFICIIANFNAELETKNRIFVKSTLDSLFFRTLQGEVKGSTLNVLDAWSIFSRF